MKQHMKLLAVGTFVAALAVLAAPRAVAVNYGSGMGPNGTGIDPWGRPCITNFGWASIPTGNTFDSFLHDGNMNIAYDVTVVTNSVHCVAGCTYYLNGTVYIYKNSTIKIDPGTVFRGLTPDQSQDHQYPGSLCISAGSKMFANGTPSHPIVFTDQWDDNIPGSGFPTATATNLDPRLVTYFSTFPGNNGTITISTSGVAANARDYRTWHPHTGNWGGVMHCGKTFVAIGPNGERPSTGTPALGPDPSNKANIEGLTTAGALSQWGGGDDDDSSGEMTYCQTRYGGFPLGLGNEINGWSIAAMGRGTVFHHMETVNSEDDGIEWFGGTVNTKYLVVWAAGDDQFDTDCGYRGKRQFGFAVKGEEGKGQTYSLINDGGQIAGSVYSDKAFEMDGGDDRDAVPNDSSYQQPFGLSVDYNFTVIGKGASNETCALYCNEGAGTVTSTNWYYGIEKDACFHNRDGVGHQAYNGVFVDFGGVGTLIQNDANPYTNVAMTVAAGNVYTNSSVHHYLMRYDDFSFARDGHLTGNAAEYYYKPHGQFTQQPGFQSDYRDNVWYGFLTNGMGANVDGVSCTNMLSATVYSQSGHKEVYLNCPMADIMHENLRTTDWDGTAIPAGTNWNNQLVNTLPIMSLVRTNGLITGQKHVPLTQPYMRNVIKINPLPNPAVIMDASPRTAPNDGFFTPVNYYGAFGPTNNWLVGWTCVDALGLIDHPNANPRVNPTISMTSTSAVISFATVSGVQYSVEAGPDGHQWTPQTLVTGNGSTKVVEDTSALTNQHFYQVIVP